MGDNADSKAKLEAAREQAIAEQALRTETAPVTPVRSAKDAINAMYAQGPDKRLSSYLAKSAKEIINSGGSGNDQKTAASLHQHATKRRIEMERPSASGVLRVASSEPPVIPDDLSHAMDPLAQKTTPVAKPRIVKPTESTTPPIIKTSLKLGPKKTTAAATRPAASATMSRSLNGQKGSTALSQFLANRRTKSVQNPQNTQATPINQPTQAPHTTAPVSDIRRTTPKKVSIATTPSQPSIDPNTAESIRAMHQAVKQTTGQSLGPISPRPRKRTSRGSMQDVIRTPRPAQANPTTFDQSFSDDLPADSVKRRFRAAPKGYKAAPATQSAGYAGFDPAATNTYANAKKPPVEIYGLMDEEPTGKRPNPNLPVIEDYQPKNAPASDDAKTPDNNKYALKGQSPFFLKSVNVEKRPLSGSVGSKNGKKSPSEGTLYERPATTPVAGKNVYDRKEARKALPTKPTVIIPASRRSRAPLIFLLILTVILGAAVGAFIYLCFFQYME